MATKTQWQTIKGSSPKSAFKPSMFSGVLLLSCILVMLNINIVNPSVSVTVIALLSLAALSGYLLFVTNSTVLKVCLALIAAGSLFIVKEPVLKSPEVANNINNDIVGWPYALNLTMYEPDVFSSSVDNIWASLDWGIEQATKSVFVGEAINAIAVKLDRYSPEAAAAAQVEFDILLKATGIGSNAESPNADQ